MTKLIIKMYLTDLTETEWQYITKVLNLQTRKRKYDLREIWNVVFYFVKTGCQWRFSAQGGLEIASSIFSLLQKPTYHEGNLQLKALCQS